MITIELPEPSEMEKTRIMTQISNRVGRYNYIGVSNKIPEKPGIYFIFNKFNKLLYIGQTNKLRKRIVQHTTNWDAETIYITLYTPPKNNTAETPWNNYKPDHVYDIEDLVKHHPAFTGGW